MNSKLIPVAVILANLMIIVASQSGDQEAEGNIIPISKKLCDGVLQPNEVSKNLKNHRNKEEFIGRLKVKELLKIETIKLLSGARDICVKARGTCTNIMTYCRYYYQELRAVYNLRKYPKEISATYMSQLCNDHINERQVSELLIYHLDKEENIEFTSVGELALMENLGKQDCEKLDSYKETCGFSREICPRINNYCDDRYRKLEKICTGQ